MHQNSTKCHNSAVYILQHSVEGYIDCWIVTFGRILMHLNVTSNCCHHTWYVVNLKYLFRNFHVHIAMKPFRVLTKWRQNPHLHDIANICLEFQSCIRIHYKVTGLQSLEKLYYSRFLLGNGPCVMKLIWTEKLFGVRRLKFCICHLDNWATH